MGLELEVIRDMACNSPRLLEKTFGKFHFNGCCGLEVKFRGLLLGRERRLAAARSVYFWSTMRVDTDAYVDRCLKCAQHKGTVPRPAPILEYPPPDRSLDVVSIDLPQLPASHQGSIYLSACVDHFR